MAEHRQMKMANGCPVDNDTDLATAGPSGPALLQNVHFFQKMCQFNREKIPERIVHAHGSGAHGTFTVTHDISQYCKADLFSHIGKKTELFVRFSSVTKEKGSSDTVLDPRGFSVKFYTQEGNWDLVGLNLPVFFVRDALKFPDMIRCQKKDPRNDLLNESTKWDFFSNMPESLHVVTMLYSDRGIPMSYRNMNGFGINTYSFINSAGERVWVKFHLLTKQGIKNLTHVQAGLLAAQEPDCVGKDLFEAIKRGDYPKWKMCCQIMTETQSFSHAGAFDVTKVWPHKQFPLHEIGEIELNKNVSNFFSEVEQVAFSPSNVVPGISYSPDKNLQGRLVAYEDSERYRMGVNFHQIPINQSKNAKTTDMFHHGGAMDVSAAFNFPDYVPSSYSCLKDSKQLQEPPLRVDGNATHYSQNLGTDEDFFQQPGDLFRLLPEDERQRLAENIAHSMETVPQEIFKRQLALFYKADHTYGQMVEEKMKDLKHGMAKRTDAEMLQANYSTFLRNNPPKVTMLT